MSPLNLGNVLHLTTVKITFLCKSLLKGSSQNNRQTHIHTINLVLLMKDKGCPAGCVCTSPNLGNGMLYNCERCSQCPLNEGNAGCWCQKKIRGNRTGSANSSQDKTVSFLPQKHVACMQDSCSGDQKKVYMESDGKACHHTLMSPNSCV